MERKDEKKKRNQNCERKIQNPTGEIRLREKIALGFSKTSQIFAFQKKEIT